jgi:serine/threonine-protein kinase
MPDAIVAVSAASSLGMYIYMRKRDRAPEFLLRIGLIYMVLMCLAIALVMHVGLPSGESLQPMISWIGVVLLMFAAIVPVAPREMMIASFIGASTGPLAMVATRVHGLPPLTALKTGILMHYSDFLLAGVAIIISRVVTRLGQQVSKAREMGSYQLGDLIRRGGMGEVYKATHRMLARPAAIKLIRSEMISSESEEAEVAVKRFHREAEAAANLRSPHTVELFDFGVTEDKTLYFVMELLDGMDLETLVREHGPLPAARVIYILKQACESLEEAHTQGLVHRDIKPANLHLGKVGVSYDFVKVLDFGLVKSVHKEDSQVSLATAVGRTPGTPSYMAPEMALGEGVDARSDIYALGCVAYFLLTGKLVFDAETTFQMIAKHMRNQPVPPSLRGNVEIVPPLEDLVLRCLSKHPEERPQSAADLSDSLAAIRIPEWTQADARAWWSNHQPVAPALVPSVNSGAGITSI